MQYLYIVFVDKSLEECVYSL